MYAADTIVALATPPGRGAVAVIRLSGPRAHEILHQLWTPLGPGALRPRELRLGRVFDRGQEIDRALAVVMRGPRTLTGENVAELHAHGGRYLVSRVLSASIALGARAAEPGEFLRRGYLNGRLRLTEAEAIADLVDAQSESSLSLAIGQLAGALQAKIAILREKLISVGAQLEVQIDFSDEDVAPASAAELVRQMDLLINDVALLHTSYERGRLLRDGARATIVGRPNVGKSSVLNLLLGSERAIVSAIPGTTRDVVEDSIQVGPHRLTLSDTAGIRASTDEVERLGIERSRAAAREADLLIAVFDCSAALTCEDREVLRMSGSRAGVALLNKCDLAPVVSAEALRESGLAMPVLAFSAKTAAGLPELRAELERAVATLAGPPAGDGIAITRERHRDALARGLTALEAARASLLGAMPPEIVAVDIQAAAAALGAITGEVSSEDVLDAIFREFCIGK
ncbi:MAG TPA: tRNA uridine-5-carboxymethylaminomethyl(34) synthesis GTPase MnmE [Candidatus Binataceae bacterium]|nr:tRNA uridine-5-carboxymethylaminomethyl(34) synthesis GTPase MnmE [Candidatus Binataceae bacterium]